jgi:hypothetical protein
MTPFEVGDDAVHHLVGGLAQTILLIHASQNAIAMERFHEGLVQKLV